MRFHVLTLFPDMVRQGLNTSILGRAAANNCIDIEAVNIRDYTEDRHGKTDDYTYGGGAGMLMQAQPVYDAWKSVADRSSIRAEKGQVLCPGLRTVYVTPQGVPFTQKLAAELAREEELIFLCGHYEGVDERVLEEIVTDYVSIGDYVLTGGELAAMVMIDAIARLVPGVLHNDESAQTESFHNDLLEYPQYSRPEEWHGRRVPEVLLSGDHKKIAAWRLQQSRERTGRVRPDLYSKYLEKEELIQKLCRNKRHNLHMMESLSRGRADILYHKGESVLLYDPFSRLYMMRGDPAEQNSAEEMADLIPEHASLAVVSQEFLKELLCSRSGKWDIMECKQACYTRRNFLPVRHKDIRKLSGEHLEYAAAHYDGGSEEYLRERIKSGALYGAFAEDRLVGFAGWHHDGSLGLLYVEPGFRKQGLGASLEAFVINLHLAKGYTPYGHVRAENTVSLKMQERMGLYLSAESIWWLEKKD